MKRSISSVPPFSTLPEARNVIQNVVSSLGNSLTDQLNSLSTSPLDGKGLRGTNVSDPSQPLDIANKQYVDRQVSSKVGVSTLNGRKLISSIAPYVGSPLTVEADTLTVLINGINSTYLASAAVQATNMGSAAITAANLALDANSVVDGNVANVGVSKLIAGTKIFTGDVILSRGNGNPVITLNNSGLYLFSAATSGSVGLTSDPYAVIQSTGITLYSGADPSLTLNPSSLVFWAKNGDTSQPYVSVSSSQIYLSYGNFTTAINAANITMSYSGGPYLALYSNQIKLLSSGTNYITIDNTNGIILYEGGNYTQLTSSQILLNGPAGTLTLSSDGIVLTDGSYSVTVSSSKVELLGPSSGKLTLTSGSVSLYSNASSYITIDNADGLTITNGSATTINGNSIACGTIVTVSMNTTVLTLTGVGATINLPASLISSSTASNGYAAQPTLVQGFIVFYYAGNPYKIPYYNN